MLRRVSNYGWKYLHAEIVTQLKFLWDQTYLRQISFIFWQPIIAAEKTDTYIDFIKNTRDSISSSFICQLQNGLGLIDVESFVNFWQLWNEWNVVFSDLWFIDSGSMDSAECAVQFCIDYLCRLLIQIWVNDFTNTPPQSDSISFQILKYARIRRIC